MRNLVTISDATIDALVANSQARELFPCLKNHSQQHVRKACCGKTRTTHVVQAYEGTKKCLADLGPKRLQALKGILDARQLRIMTTSGNRRIVLTV